MKQVMRKFAALTVIEIFLFSSLFPAWADPFPTPTSSLLRQRQTARDGSDLEAIREELEEQSKTAQDGGSRTGLRSVGITRREGKGFWVGEDLFIHIYDIEKDKVLLQIERKGQILMTVPMRVGQEPWNSFTRGILAKGVDGGDYSFGLYLREVTKREARLFVVAPEMVRIDQPEVMKSESDSARDGGRKDAREGLVRKRGLAITRREGERFWVGEDLLIRVSNIGSRTVTLHMEQGGQAPLDVPIAVGQKVWQSFTKGLLAKGEDGKEYPFSIWLAGIERGARLFVKAPKIVRIDRPEIRERRDRGIPPPEAKDGARKVLKDGGNQESAWPELAYHIRRFESADPETKIAELSAIQEGLSHRPLVPRDEVVALFLKHYQTVRGEVLRAHLLGALVHLGIQNPKIQELFDQEIRSAPPRLLQEGLMAYAGTLHRREVTLISPQTLESLKKLLSHPDEEVSYAALYVFVHALGGFSEKGQGVPLLKADLLTHDASFVKRLRKLMQSREIATSYLSEDLMERLGLGRGRPDPTFEGYVDWLEAHALRKREVSPQLNEDQLGVLYGLINQNERKLPSQFMGDLFRQGKKVIFVADVTRKGRSLPFLADDILRLKEEVGLNRVALPFPASEAENLQKFARGELKLNDWDYGAAHFLAQGIDTEGALYAEAFRAFLQRLNGKVRFIFYGKEAQEGEVALTTHLHPIQEALKELGEPRILVVGIPPMGMQLARKNLVTHSEWVTLSIARELGEWIGEERIASLIQVDEETWFWDHFSDVHNLIELIEKFPIFESFGIGIQETSIALLNFSRSYQQPFGSAWDGILFRETGLDQAPQGTEVLWNKKRLGESSGEKYLEVPFGRKAWIEAGSFAYRVWMEDEDVYVRRYDKKQYTPVGSIHRLELKQLFAVGRLAGNYLLNDSTLSGIHFTMVIGRNKKGDLILGVYDLNSTNGTKVAWNEPRAVRDGGDKKLPVLPNPAPLLNAIPQEAAYTESFSFP